MTREAEFRFCSLRHARMLSRQAHIVTGHTEVPHTLFSGDPLIFRCVLCSALRWCLMAGQTETVAGLSGHDRMPGCFSLMRLMTKKAESRLPIGRHGVARSRPEARPLHVRHRLIMSVEVTSSAKTRPLGRGHPRAFVTAIAKSAAERRSDLGMLLGKRRLSRRRKSYPEHEHADKSPSLESHHFIQPTLPRRSYYNRCGCFL